MFTELQVLPATVTQIRSGSEARELCDLIELYSLLQRLVCTWNFHSLDLKKKRQIDWNVYSSAVPESLDQINTVFGCSKKRLPSQAIMYDLMADKGMWGHYENSLFHIRRLFSRLCLQSPDAKIMRLCHSRCKFLHLDLPDAWIIVLGNLQS